ncbi:MAG TPA: ABC transporter ATP-binding protein [Lacisediminihabitans sp.]|uniref:ABC transporter ATP-binding protein n=1 Tax=Lacisediminihabitans sp. TaxID=2787631 RepID=UPI002ED872C3
MTSSVHGGVGPIATTDPTGSPHLATGINIQGLTKQFRLGRKSVDALAEVNLGTTKDTFLALLGPSGCGKSTILRILAGLETPSTGEVIVNGLTPQEIRRQHAIGIAFQDSALLPWRSVEKNIRLPLEIAGIRAEPGLIAGLIDLVGLSGFEHAKPAQLSGGMRQRVSIALALSLEPQLLVFDEPTTALDVLVQHAVMDTIKQLQQSENFTALLISHDLGVVLEATARVLVMHEGAIVEDAPATDILNHPKDDYTRMLLSHYADPRAEVVELPGFEKRATPTAGARASESRAATTTLVVDHVSKVYPPPRRGEKAVTAVDDVSFILEPGEALALVGASGSGKSTIAKLITAVERPTAGTVTFGDLRIDTLGRGAFRTLHRDVQMVFQDPYAALNPLHTVEYTLTRPVVNFTGLHGREARRRVLELLETVGLSPVEQFAAKLPHQLSGGQRQRVVIARALASDPQVIIADEPVSMLDVSLRAGVLALLDDLRLQRGVSMLYITHDLLSARVVTDNILVLNAGRVVERGSTARVLRHPEDEYTVRLLDAIPNPSRDVVA